MRRTHACFLAAMATALALLQGACAILPYGAYTNTPLLLPSPPAMKSPVDTPQASQTGFRVRSARNCGPGSDIADPKRIHNALVILALSGGGSRAAYFSALTMERLQKLRIHLGQGDTDVLHEVDAISSVSGGSVAAAYYAVTADPDAKSRCPNYQGDTWDLDKSADITTLMTRDYRNRWILNWFWPTNIAKYWFTSYTRTDIMAQTLADNLYRKPYSVSNRTMKDLNPLRPNLILNATAGSYAQGLGTGAACSQGGADIAFGDVYTFTDRDFARICSNIDDYSLGRAVMASATFPGVFNFMTLRIFCPPDATAQGCDKRYLHVFDGGNGDNLGLISAKRVIWEALQSVDPPRLPYDDVEVILVDAFVKPQGADPTSRDPRGIIGHFIDTNFLDATDSLLAANRERLIADFDNARTQLFPFGSGKQSTEECPRFFSGSERSYCSLDGQGVHGKDPSEFWSALNGYVGSRLHFVTVNFTKVAGTYDGCPAGSRNCLLEQLNGISTDFRLSDDVDERTGLTAAGAIECAVSLMFDEPGAAGRYCGMLHANGKGGTLGLELVERLTDAALNARRNASGEGLLMAH